MIDALHACLSAPPTAAPTDDVHAWWPQWLALGNQGLDPPSLALRGGFQADRVGWAFASGYQAALRALHPTLPHATLAALCVTEAGGNRPRDIQTTLTPRADGQLRLDGAKRWTTLGPGSSMLLVAARWGAPAAAAGAQEQPWIRVAAVPVPSGGLTLESMPATGFVPEVPHARIEMSGVVLEADRLLPGDGYTRYVKPFRTIEDTHVTLAVLAYLLREARARGWPAEFRERLVATSWLLAGLGESDPQSAMTHVALSGALHEAHRLYREADDLWAQAGDDPAAQRWRRDAKLFQVAGTARSLRSQRAWERLQAASDLGAQA